ncbi:hypothetical protein [Streptomyces sp. 3213.3]|uniref:hypothetical protein n=1 Tax=Streptomyces sp. 3213.3 TaxID=1855348 RepID=UPI00135B860A|nr:hypothetical protein [Streptomyces sp. 3213.3]
MAVRHPVAAYLAAASTATRHVAAFRRVAAYMAARHMEAPDIGASRSAEVGP